MQDRSGVGKTPRGLSNANQSRGTLDGTPRVDVGVATHKKRPSRERAPSHARARRERKGARAPRALRRTHVILLLVAFVGLSFIVWLWWNFTQSDREFRQLAEQGQSALSEVKSVASEGFAHHVSQGSLIEYRRQPPTTGAHYPTPSAPGFYERPQPPGNLVHALEHGHIVTYYDHPSADVLQRLESWANRYQDPWAGVIVTPMPGIGEEIILTGWTTELRLQKFDAASAAAFIDRFRGRGPEHPVR